MRPNPDFMHWWLEANSRFDDCQTPDELFEETTPLTCALGFQRFAWGRRSAVPFSQTRVQFTGTYPDAWLATQDHCPSPGLLLWDETADAPGSLRDFGFASGATFTQRGRDSSWQILCVARQKGAIRSAELLPLKLHLRSLLELLDEHLERVEGRHRVLQLSDRETQVLRWLADGKCSKGIAAILELSEHTVNFHIKSILRKFDSPNRVQAVAQAAALGLI
ncbi:LuxR C-terminal-related transcriptional regulator [Pseudomonas sp. 148P]|uniref:LuxR C-terminal-related transcriptional regulator n=1 Tax=Pseudomonas ulcerans TaxID=3115852 RepID=A0ABU7HM41_9PSED|nr:MULTISPECIES: LuxR C-terminal-related transcriptional regulator [unclassified Pseudomonas]MEE1921056.1 LuxR C-terminal-related transcriptional regulator [Pseudomonas sp. 147P]MEE1932595.1 LuxR C-terminal-related transcriptional regulator [Pseudomonas sp. 148P]